MAANRTSPLHEATLQANWLLQRLGRELRLAWIAAGLTQATVAARVGSSKAQVSRIEHGMVRRVAILAIARQASAVGLRFAAQLYPGVRRVLDAPQLALLGRLRKRIGSLWTWELEVPMPKERDLRAVDALISSAGVSIAVEAITRLADVQAQVRAAHQAARHRHHSASSGGGRYQFESQSHRGGEANAGGSLRHPREARPQPPGGR